MKAFFVVLLTVVGSMSLAQNTAVLLGNTHEALNARLDLIEHSRDPFLSVFEISEDSVGLAQLGALVRCAQAGGHPRLLIDGLGHRLSHRTLQYLSDEHVDVRIFRAIHAIPVLEHGPDQALQRMHDKILTSETDDLITGGRNSADKFFGRDPKNENFIDYEVLVHGPLAHTARLYQEQLWSSSLTDQPYWFFQSPLDRAIAQTEFTAAAVILRLQGARDGIARNWSARLTPVSGEFLHDWVTPDSGATDGTQRGFLQLVRAAKKELIIDANYFMLTGEELDALASAVRRGVDVKIVTNGEHASASITDGLIQEAFELSKPRLRAIGVSVREFEGPGRIHSKSIVADGSDCLIWSFNLDPRSRYTNYEAGVRLQSPIVCGQLAVQIHGHMDTALFTIDHGRQLVADRNICPAHQALIQALEHEL